MILTDMKMGGSRTGWRAGPTSPNPVSAGALNPEFGSYSSTQLFPDYEASPTIAVREIYNQNCDSLTGSFLDYVKKLKDQKISYSLTGNNSNAFVYSLLNSAGIDADSFTPRLNAALGITRSIPGWGTSLPVK